MDLPVCGPYLTFLLNLLPVGALVMVAETDGK